ncbi:uncharacterized protein LOC124280164 isoform X2 [Haliotis rubra]|uniref:uncharacterized protein LOC124280164 isoform X2 n=1 Tax=Haliotis rubra TaxID=36100 RepID=UPI001EE50711|nr:uncharacterized protein LOC124280164 isoform X2 [Haliotis rubra]
MSASVISTTDANTIEMKFIIFFLCLLALNFGERKALIVPFDPAKDPVLDPRILQRNRCVDVALASTEQECVQDCRIECLDANSNDNLELGCEFACKGVQNLLKLIAEAKSTTAATT